MPRKTFYMRLVPAFAIALAGTSLVACGGGGSESNAGASGDISIDGSSTVYPISAAMAEEFDAVSDTRVNVAFSGTGGGFELFCNGEIQIADASRSIKATEADNCIQNGITDMIELQVGVDALTVVVHPDNDFVECLAPQDLYNLFKAGGASKWSELKPEWPDEAINFYYPDTDSGTFDYFQEQVITKLDPSVGHRGDGSPSADDNVIAQGVENDANAIGYFGFSYFRDAGSQLRAVQIDGGFGCQEPSVESVTGNTYVPLARPLYIYTRKSFLSQPDSAVLEFVKFYMEKAQELVPAIGYMNLPEDQFAIQTQKLDEYLNAAPSP